MKALQLLFDRRFYAVVFQSHLFLRQTTYVEMAPYVPAGWHMRMFREHLVEQIKEAGLAYEAVIKLHAAHSRDGIKQYIPPETSLIFRLTDSLVSNNVTRYAYIVQVGENYADRVKVKEPKYRLRYRRERLEAFRVLRDLIQTFNQLTTNLQVSRSITKTHRRRLGLRYLNRCIK